MTDPNALTPENIVATVVTGIGLGLLGLWKYLRAWKAPAAPNGDRIISGLTIADMRPFAEIATAQGALVIEQRRTADALEGIRDLLRERQEDQEKEQEIIRRAEILAQKMLRALQAEEPRTPRPRSR